MTRSTHRIARAAAPRRLLATVSGVAALAAAPIAGATPVTVTLTTPSLDRYMYPFAGGAGTEVQASLFGAFGTEDFDNRDAQMYVRFTTSPAIPAGRVPSSYTITSATVHASNSNDLVFLYDPTVDPWTSYLAPDDPAYTPDVDAGFAIELWGAGFRNRFTVTTFAENTPFAPGDPLGKEKRSVYALGRDLDGAWTDVSNSVDAEYDAVPFATGQIAGVEPGAFVPVGSDIVFTIDVADPGIQSYLQEALAGGELPLVLASLQIVDFMAGSFPRIYTKEHPLVPLGLASAAWIELVVDVGAPLAGDIDGNGVVDGADLGALLGAWGTDNAAADLNGDGTVDGADLGALLGAWT